MSKLIIVEGPDFCGKSTQIELLNLNTVLTRTLGDNVYFTREPGSLLPESQEECEAIRKQILYNNNSVIDEVDLFAQSRYFHTREIIKLLQEKDATVISDRYIISSLAYQGYAQGLGADVIYDFNRPTLNMLEEHNIPIHCIKFNIDKKEWDLRRLKRLQHESADSIEQKNIHKEVLEFFTDKAIFNDYTSKLNQLHVYELDAGREHYKVYADFLETVVSIVNN